MSVQGEVNEQPAATEQQPVEQQAPQGTEQSTEQQPTEQQEAQPEQSAQQPRDENGRFKGVQDRINELTRRRGEAEREAAYWRQLAQGKGASSAEQAAPSKPTPDQFDDHNAYVEALAEFKAKEIFEKATAERAQQEATHQRAATFAERQNAFRQQAADYDDVVGNADIAVQPHVLDLLQESDLGPAMAYHMAKNPAVAERLNGLSPVQAAREFGKIEATLSTPAPAPAAPVKQPSKAPAPIKPVASGAAAPVQLDSAGMDEYIRQRKAQGASWAR